jgi:hypothetical protein
MAAGEEDVAPIAPMPPALATAADSAAGQAPAIGARRIGARNPYRAQKASARELAAMVRAAYS